MKLVPLSRLLARSRPDDTVVAWRDGKAIRFSQFRAMALAVAASATRGQRVALVCRDSVHFAAGFLGLIQAGAEVVLPANDHPALLAAMSGTFERLLDDAAVLETSGAAPLDPVSADTAPITFFTSGSTGRPKPVTRTLVMLEHEVAALNTAFGGLSGRGRVLATVSHQHLYGLTFKLLWPLSSGRAFDAVTHEVWETVFDACPGDGIVVSSPAHVSRLGGFGPLPMTHRPQAVFCAGAPLEAADAKAARAILGVLPTEIFGSTESGAVATRAQATGNESWRLLPGMEIRLEADGLAAFRSPQVADWVSTGDLIAQSIDGFRFLGRADGVVKVEGKRVSLAAVEQALAALPEVGMAAVLLLPGPPVRLAAVVVPSIAGWRKLEEQGHFRFGRCIARDLAQRLDASSRPKLWRFVEALPHLHMGKRDTVALTDLFESAPA